MGTDCRLLAKLRDGTYRHKSLDRLYVFNLSYKDHKDIYAAGGLVKDEDGVYVTNYRFTLEYLTEWIYERRKQIVHSTIEQRVEEGIRDDQDYSYYIYWLNKALDFVIAMLDFKNQIEWVALYEDMHDLYFDLENEGATIIDI